MLGLGLALVSVVVSDAVSDVVISHTPISAVVHYY